MKKSNKTATRGTVGSILVPIRAKMEIPVGGSVRTFRSANLLLFLLLTLAIGASASSLYIGNDIQTPVTVYTTAGVFVQNFGQTGATGTAIDSAGHVWTVAPAFGNNHVVK